MKVKNQIRFPKPLKPKDKIGVTAPSAGTEPEYHPRLDLVLSNLRKQGFEVVEGECLRQSHKHVSDSKEKRAAELMRFWMDPEIRAVMPPWGGELLIEILPLIDFDQMASVEPKWISGYSDISTLLFALTIKTGIATLHGSNLMELSPTQSDPLTTGLLSAMQMAHGGQLKQVSSDRFQKQFSDFRVMVDSPLNLTEPTQWKSLQSMAQVEFSGRLIGGCLDTILNLVGTPYGDLNEFKDSYGADGVIFYFENVELTPLAMARALWNLRLAGWFEGLAGIMVGRSTGPDAGSPIDVSYLESLHSVLGDLPCPVIFDVDIGHQPPNLNLINGAMATVTYNRGKGQIVQLKGI